jgi:redox-sensing transcriptional repressor
MARKIKIPVTTINRLSLYLRVFSQTDKAQQDTISSKVLAELTGMNSAQVRKDLAYFGQFGRRGVGYSIAGLKAQISGILGLNRDWNVAIIGMGHLGTALMMYGGFGRLRFKVAAAFDSDPDKISWELEGIRIHDIADLPQVVKEKKIEIAVLTVPAEVAQEVANQVAAAEIPAILNFAPVRLVVPSQVLLRDVDFASELEALTYELHKV